MKEREKRKSRSKNKKIQKSSEVFAGLQPDEECYIRFLFFHQ